MKKQHPAAVLFAGLAALFIASKAHAHDFWLELSPWRAAPGGTVGIDLLVGHATDRAHWGGDPKRVTVFDRLVADDAADLRPDLVFDRARKTWSGRIPTGSAPVAVFAFETNETTSALDAEKFDAYAREEGLALVIAHRASTEAASRSGRELYSRRAKALFATAAAMTDRTPPPLARQTLEIAPLANPFALGQDEALALQVLYKGAPLAGASVKFESLDSGLLPPHRETTDAAGEVKFRFPKRGAWKATVVWSEPIEGDPSAEYRTIFSSLTFGL